MKKIELHLLLILIFLFALFVLRQLVFGVRIISFP